MKKLILFLQSVHLLLYRSSKRFKKQTEPFNICDKLRTVKSVLIFMPNDSAQASPAIPTIKALQDNFSSWEITVCSVGEIKMTGRKGMNVLRTEEKDLSFYGLPKKTFLQKLFNRKFDMTIDLSIEWDFTNFVMSWIGASELRLGFYQPQREDFYNFLMRQKADATPEQAGELLVNTIKSL